jgi:hypothetical protein
MAARDADPTFDPFREDLVAYLAERLGVPHDVALSMLGDWLLDFERAHMLAARTQERS